MDLMLLSLSIKVFELESEFYFGWTCSKNVCFYVEAPYMCPLESCSHKAVS